MRGIDRYILRQLIVGMVLVTLGLTAILWLTQSLRFVELTVSKGASILEFLTLTLLIVPNFLTVILPVSVFAVVLFIYDRLTADRELVVLRAMGVSHVALARPALILALGCAAIGFVLNLWLIPLSVSAFHGLQWQLRSTATGILIREGAFTQIANGLTVYVKSRTADGDLLGIIVDDRRNPREPITLMAERGALTHTADGTPEVVMFNGTRQQVTKGSDRLSLLHFDNYAMEFNEGSAGQRIQGHDPREQSMAQLFAADEGTMDPSLYRQFRVEAYQRLASPLYDFTFALIAAACLLAGHFNRRGQLDRIAIGVGLMIAIQAMALGISDLAARNLALLPLVYLGPIVPAMAGAWILLRPGFTDGAANAAVPAG
jgi:lipopolysaccharide export system permease protein